MKEPDAGEPNPEEPGADETGGSPRGPLIALAVVVLLVLGGVWLQQRLGATVRLQDCVMSGRTNCAPLR